MAIAPNNLVSRLRVLRIVVLRIRLGMTAVQGGVRLDNPLIKGTKRFKAVLLSLASFKFVAVAPLTSTSRISQTHAMCVGVQTRADIVIKLLSTHA